MWVDLTDCQYKCDDSPKKCSSFFFKSLPIGYKTTDKATILSDSFGINKTLQRQNSYIAKTSTILHNNLIKKGGYGKNTIFSNIATAYTIKKYHPLYNTKEKEKSTLISHGVLDHTQSRNWSFRPDKEIYAKIGACHICR